MAAAAGDGGKRSRSLDTAGRPPSPSNVKFQRMKDFNAQHMKSELQNTFAGGDAQQTLNKLVELTAKIIDAVADAAQVTEDHAKGCEVIYGGGTTTSTSLTRTQLRLDQLKDPSAP